MSRIVEKVKIIPITISKLSWGKSFRYYINIDGVDIRISKDLYQNIKAVNESFFL